MKKTTCLLLIIFSIFFVSILVFLYSNISHLNSSSDLRNTFITPTPALLASCVVDGYQYLSGESFPINDGVNICTCNDAVISCSEEALPTQKITMPLVISNLYQKINQTFGLNLVPVFENEFYSPSGMLSQNSWKVNFSQDISKKELATFLGQELESNEMESGDVGGGAINGYQNDQIKCFHIYGYKGGDPNNWTDPFDYLSCSEK